MSNPNKNCLFSDKSKTYKLIVYMAILLNNLNYRHFFFRSFIVSENMLNFASEKKLDFFIVKV